MFALIKQSKKIDLEIASDISSIIHYLNILILYKNHASEKIGKLSNIHCSYQLRAKKWNLTSIGNL